MEIAGSVASIAQCLCGECCSKESIFEQCSHMKNPRIVVESLEHGIQRLVALETDLVTKLHMEKILRGREPTAEVKLWLDNVQKMKGVQLILDEKVQESKSRVCGCFPNYYHRLKLRNYAILKTHEVNSLIEQNNFSDSLLVNMVPARGQTLPTTALVGETAKRILQTAWEYIMDTNIGRIGVYGMGGVGKTTLIKEINNKLLRENTHFDDVIWVTASKDSNVQKLQKDIAKKIGLFVNDSDSEDTRASDLFGALLRRKRFFLIIDDLWESFSLECIGVPTPTSTNNCKILITTRSLSVCCSMETTRDIEIHVLSENESWDLFREKVGEEVLLFPRINELAKQVAKECGGLPLALITIGRALRKENNIKQWESALSELRNSTESIQGMENQVFARLNISYERLKNDTIRACFLYCALYPEDHLIEVEELIKYWAWEGLLGSSGSHIAKMHFGQMILNELKSASMLERVYQEESSNEYVKMHDLIRDMAIAHTRGNLTFMVKSGHGLETQPLENEWHPDLVRVSLMRNDLSFLSGQPKCPKLCTLLLQYNSFINCMDKQINHFFFQNMPNLKVLDLSYTGINTLPGSLSDLENLHTLLLRSCWNLCFVPSLMKLKELRVLDLSYTSIELLPEGMDMLVKLEYLDLSFSKGFEFPYLLLQNYSFLECLFLISPGKLDIIPVYDITMCKRLVVLQLNFSNMHDFQDYISSYHWKLLDNFSFFIGYVPSSTHTAHTGRNFVGFFGVDIDDNFNSSWWPVKINELEICYSQSITQLPHFLTIPTSQLQRCKITHCHKIECIITPGSTFPNLEWLEIDSLCSLSQLGRGIIMGDTFANLKTLIVIACNQLRTLLPFKLVQNLKKLVELRIEHCDYIEEVISTGEDNGEITQVNFPDTVLPNLKIVKLSYLRKLKHMSRGLMVCDFLSSLEVFGCPNLETLPFFVGIKKELVDSIKEIKGSRTWWETIRRNHRVAAGLLDPVFREAPELSATGVDPIPEVSAMENGSRPSSSCSSFDIPR